MASSFGSFPLVLGVAALILVAIYIVKPSLFDFMNKKSGFANATMGEDSNSSQEAPPDMAGSKQISDMLANANALTSQLGSSSITDMLNKNKKDASGNSTQGFANMDDVAGPSEFEGAQGPAGCYPRDQLTPSELLPKDPNSVWAQQNPMGQGSLKGKNFLSAGALIGVNTVGQSLRNANLQLRSEPPNPQVPVSVFYNSTIQPDTSHRDLEIN